MQLLTTDSAMNTGFKFLSSQLIFISSKLLHNFRDILYSNILNSGTLTSTWPIFIRLVYILISSNCIVTNAKKHAC